ncbi:hypothetical protein [Coraliomargarita akajimensis]|uniref:hypothetical protein n=1 Tax=Coraliomargarita akajimensis TaxID=395922 RepID=UPI0011D12098|nr:hypothetical protein [Coraliomargarita akajimensis]
MASYATAETWTLTDRQGRSIVVEEIFYDGVNLSIRRVDDYRKIKLNPKLLTDECWQGLNREFGSAVKLRMEVTRRTKTSSDRDRQVNYTSFSYTHSTEQKDIQKRTIYDIEIRSPSYFSSDVRVEYFIFSDEEVDYGRESRIAKINEPILLSVSKTLEKSERSYSSTYSGTYYKRESGNTKADVVVRVYNLEGALICEYTTSQKVKDRFLGLESLLKQRMGTSATVAQQSTDLDDL